LKLIKLCKYCLYLSLCAAILVAARLFVKETQARRLGETEVLFHKYEGNLAAPLVRSLQERGVARDEAMKVIKKLNEVLNMRRLAPRDSYLLSLDENDNFKLLLVTKDFSRYYVAQSDGILTAGIIDISTAPAKKLAKGSVDAALFTSMQAQGLKPYFIVDFTDIFSWNIDFNAETRSGDSYACYWQEETTKDARSLNETILAAYYKGAAAGVNYAIRFEGEYYDQNGKFAKKMFLKSPISVRGVRISSRFNRNRLHPILRIRRPHLGIDYAAPSGTPVEAVADGVVRVKKWEGGFGNYLEIAHPNNYTTTYGHLKGYAKGVEIGVKVRQGQTIGYVGATGLATGPHLDFRMRINKTYVDYLNSKNRSSAAREIPASKRAEFNKIKEEYIKILGDANGSAD
jgi:murein DD-endopeptidase MepM/ murein hydrolase activator NlpD